MDSERLDMLTEDAQVDLYLFILGILAEDDSSHTAWTYFEEGSAKMRGVNWNDEKCCWKMFKAIKKAPPVLPARTVQFPT